MSEETPVTAAEPSSARLALTLAFAGLVSGLALVGVYELTMPRIRANQAEALRKAVFEVVPGADSMRKLVREGEALVPSEDERPGVYAAYRGGAFTGFAVPAEGPGFQDTIRLLFGLSPDGTKVIGMRVLESRETPGLGDKIFKDLKFVAQFDDLAVDPEVQVVKPGSGTETGLPHQIDAITGATISSKAVARIINDANTAWRPRLPAPDAVPPPAAPQARAEGK